jgi:hypothetical protein
MNLDDLNISFASSRKTGRATSLAVECDAEIFLKLTSELVRLRSEVDPSGSSQNGQVFAEALVISSETGDRSSDL